MLAADLTVSGLTCTPMQKTFKQRHVRESCAGEQASLHLPAGQHARVA
jgi:hypothetical protein